MSRARATLDLHVDVGGPRVRAGLEAALREAVRSGRLAPGTRLPSSRSLAADLGVARNTVAGAYEQLVAEGWLVARHGSGTRVAPSAGGAVAPGVASAGGADPAPPPRPRHDLRPGSPDVAAFPRAAWLAASRRALADAPFDALGYGDPRGRPELRAALAAYLARVRGVRVTPDRLVVCAGFTQGLAVLSRALHDRGVRALAAEDHGQPSHREVAAAAGLAIRTLAVDDDAGARTAGLAATDAGAVLLTPAHQFPLGGVLAPGRRAAALDWAQATGGVVVEDDYDGEFRYDRQPVGAMQALAPEHVVYAGTASKTLAPGLRLGWLALPADLVAGVVAAKERDDRHSAVLDQLTLARLIEGGGYDRHVRAVRLVYRRRRDRLLAALAREVPSVRPAGVAAGLHLVLELPAGVQEAAVVAGAAARGLALEGLAAYRATDADPRPPTLIVGFGAPAQHEVTTAVAQRRDEPRDAGC